MFEKANGKNTQSISYEIAHNILFLKIGHTITKKIVFDFQIRQVIQFKDKFLIRVEPAIGKIFNENVYCYSSGGQLLWQINPTSTIDLDCPYTNIIVHNDNLFLYNWSGEKIQVNPSNGQIIKKEFTK